MIFCKSGYLVVSVAIYAHILQIAPLPDKLFRRKKAFFCHLDESLK